MTPPKILNLLEQKRLDEQIESDIDEMIERDHLLDVPAVTDGLGFDVDEEPGGIGA